MTNQPNSGDPAQQWQQRYYDRYLNEDSTGPQGSAPSPGPRRGRRGVIIAAAATLVVVLVGGTALVLSRHGGTSAASSSTTSSSSAPAQSASVVAGLQPTIPGWQPMINSDGNLAYDVPPTWTVNRNTSVYWNKNDGSGGTLSMMRPGMFGQGYCKADPSYVAAAIGFRTAGNMDPSNASPQDFSDISSAMSINKDKQTYAAVDDQKTTTTTVSGLSAVLTTGMVHEGTGGDGTKCVKLTDLRVLSLTIGGRTETVVLAAGDENGKPSVSSADMTKILGTVRVVKSS